MNTDWGFKSHPRHCIVSLSKTHWSLLSAGSTQEDLSPHNWKNVDWDVKIKIKQKTNYYEQLECRSRVYPQ